MTQSLEEISQWADAFLDHLSPVAQRKLAAEIGRELRRQQQRQIVAQRNPDGTPFEARKKNLKKKKGALRRKMFTRLRQARFMQVAATSAGVSVGYLRAGRIANIARTHHFGLREKTPTGASIQYPERQLIGLTPASLEAIKSRVLGAMATADV